MVVTDALARAGHGEKTVLQLYNELQALEPDAKLSAQMATQLNGTMKELLNVLKVESGRRHAYVPESRRFDVERLLNNPSQLFASELFDALPDLVKYDLSESGRCLAFGLPTAAAFHALRAIEGELRDFYRDWIRQSG